MAYGSRLYIYILMVVIGASAYYFSYRYEMQPRTAEQSYAAIRRAYDQGEYEKMGNLAVVHRHVFGNSFHDQLASLENSAAREKEAKALFADIQKAIKQRQSLEAYIKIEAYKQMYPNCADGDEIRALSNKYKAFNEQALAEAALVTTVGGRPKVNTVQMMIIDVASSTRRLTVAVYIPQPSQETIMSAVRRIRLEMPAWEHEIICLTDPDFSINNRQENGDKIAAIYLSVTRTLRLINIADGGTEIKDFP